MFNLGLPELIIIFCVGILLFYAKALPKAAAGLAKAIKNFRKEMQGKDDEDKTNPPS